MPDTIFLPDVTLVTVTSVEIDAANMALQQSMAGLAFGAVKMLCSELPQQPDRRIRYVPIPPINLQQYNAFMLGSLHEHIDTSHCLIVQADGFVLAPARWEAGFLDHDYIGSPFPEVLYMSDNTPIRLDQNRVGNGGFSLRSRRMLEFTARLGLESFVFPVMTEDMITCHYLYDKARAAGLSYAPLDMAGRFGIETDGMVPGQAIDTVFGFHSAYWLDRVDAVLQANKICSCGSGMRFADCHGRLWG